MKIKFKLFESVENYEVIATNESSHHYEYDNFIATAKILLDRNDNSLYLQIKNVHIKTGLGAGTFQKQGEFVKIGNIEKADLALVRTLLKKHNYDQKKFSIHWEDEEGNKMSLTDLLKTYKPQKSEMKHIKSISNFEQPKKEKVFNIELVKYSDKSYALFGEGTKNIKDKLIDLGCRYNKFLTDPNTGQKRPGWIFPTSKLDKIKELL